LTAADAESLLLKAGFVLTRSKGSHRIYIHIGKAVTCGGVHPVDQGEDLGR
jgi:predicted RNA binding protein YcfA (HicA-like mRNA interferase family)